MKIVYDRHPSRLVNNYPMVSKELPKYQAAWFKQHMASQGGSSSKWFARPRGTYPHKLCYVITYVWRCPGFSCGDNLVRLIMWPSQSSSQLHLLQPPSPPQIWAEEQTESSSGGICWHHHMHMTAHPTFMDQFLAPTITWPCTDVWEQCSYHHQIINVPLLVLWYTVQQIHYVWWDLFWLVMIWAAQAARVSPKITVSISLFYGPRN